MTRLKRKKDLPSSHRDDVRFGTPELVAEYRAQRLAALHPDTIIEIGAGAGFQTKAFAKVAARVIAVDIDEARLQRALMPENVISIAGDALHKGVFDKVKEHATGRVAIFLDPERPPAAAQRSIDEIRPDLREFLRLYGTISPDIAIELPPFLTNIPFACEREYLSIDGKLNRLTVYTGALRRCDLSVVRLPGGARLEHNGPLPQRNPQAHVVKKHVLEPDAALSHAGLADAALDVPCQEEQMGKKSIFVSAERTKSPFFTAYKILAVGEEQVERALPRMDCATVILHGQLEQEEQRSLLARLNRLCKGKRRLHLFLAGEWYLTSKLQPSAITV